MKLLSSIRLDSLIMPIFFIFFYNYHSTSSSNSGHGRKTPVCASSKYEGSPCVSTSTDRRMHQYRSPDVPVQIAGCASTDRQMCTVCELQKSSKNKFLFAINFQQNDWLSKYILSVSWDGNDRYWQNWQISTGRRSDDKMRGIGFPTPDLE